MTRLLPSFGNGSASGTNLSEKREKVPGTSFQTSAILKTTVALVGLVLIFTLSACIRVHIIHTEISQSTMTNSLPTGSDPTVQTPVTIVPEAFKQLGQCKLSSPILNNRQDTGSWCWAASAQLLIGYLRNDIKPTPSQCQLVTETFQANLTGSIVTCCDWLNGNHDASSVANICNSGDWPDTILRKYQIKWTLRSWATGETSDWGILTGEICGNRPFLFVVRWDGGGRHTSIVAGYHITADYGQFIEVDDNGSSDVYVMPYADWGGVTGDFTHEFDYIDMQHQ
jgi:hypothetical protein